jgi:hypothetical protein
MGDPDEAIDDTDRFAPMTWIRLAAIYLIVWLACGVLALVVHLVCAPHYIDVPTRFVGGAANLFGPWARVLARQWPNGGEAPHTPSAFIGLVVLVLMSAVILYSFTVGDRSIQRLCVVAFVFLMALWIGVGFLELMVCAA